MAICYEKYFTDTLNDLHNGEYSDLDVTTYDRVYGPVCAKVKFTAARTNKFGELTIYCASRRDPAAVTTTTASLPLVEQTRHLFRPWQISRNKQEERTMFSIDPLELILAGETSPDFEISGSAEEVESYVMDKMHKSALLSTEERPMYKSVLDVGSSSMTKKDVYRLMHLSRFLVARQMAIHGGAAMLFDLQVEIRSIKNKQDVQKWTSEYIQQIARVGREFKIYMTSLFSVVHARTCGLDEPSCKLRHDHVNQENRISLVFGGVSPIQELNCTLRQVNRDDTFDIQKLCDESASLEKDALVEIQKQNPGRLTFESKTSGSQRDIEALSRLVNIVFGYGPRANLAISSSESKDVSDRKLACREARDLVYELEQKQNWATVLPKLKKLIDPALRNQISENRQFKTVSDRLKDIFNQKSNHPGVEIDKWIFMVADKLTRNLGFTSRMAGGYRPVASAPAPASASQSTGGAFEGLDAIPGMGNLNPNPSVPQVNLDFTNAQREIVRPARTAPAATSRRRAAAPPAAPPAADAPAAPPAAAPVPSAPAAPAVPAVEVAPAQMAVMASVASQDEINRFLRSMNDDMRRFLSTHDKQMLLREAPRRRTHMADMFRRTGDQEAAHARLKIPTFPVGSESDRIIKAILKDTVWCGNTNDLPQGYLPGDAKTCFDYGKRVGYAAGKRGGRGSAGAAAGAGRSYAQPVAARVVVARGSQ